MLVTGIQEGLENTKGVEKYIQRDDDMEPPKPRERCDCQVQDGQRLLDSTQPSVSQDTLKSSSPRWKSVVSQSCKIKEIIHIGVPVCWLQTSHQKPYTPGGSEAET